MQKVRPTPALLAAIAGLAVLGGCAGRSATLADGSPAPRGADSGVLLASSAMVPGSLQAAAVGGLTADCSGPGLGVMVEGSLSGNRYLYDANGEPCEPAQMLFDGSTAADARAADPSIALTFFDSPTPLPARATSSLPALPNVKVASELLAKMPPAHPQEELPQPKPMAPGSNIGQPAAKVSQVAPAQQDLLPKHVVEQKPAPKVDPLVEQLGTWQAVDNTAAARMGEADAAAARNLARIADEKRAASEQETIAQLSAKLRERERQIQEEQRRHAETLERAATTRAQTSAEEATRRQHEAQLQDELEATQKRLQEFEALAKQLQAEKGQKEKAYQNKISSLSTNLKQAEAQADDSRRQLIAAAAAKIAEAEQLANAAQIQEQQAKLREAERLKAEAETMMDRALALRAGQSVHDMLNANQVEPAAGPVALDDVMVTVHAKNQSLQGLTDAVLAQAAAHGSEKWQADWQLSPENQYLMAEKWSLTAEAPVQQVLAQLAAQVKAAHNITLTFTQFEKSHLLVVTDTPSAAKK
ncbi:MAG: hypothetical protein GC129_01540 [Proteobacteria bacterium]|nr:hypothetical protein [Pseudomonadota bacterium]